MWRHLAPHDAPRPWQRRAMVDRGGFGDDGQQQVVLALCDSAWHGGLASGCFVCGLGGLGAR